MTWLFPTIAWTLAALALALLTWALFWDRPRGRKRCPKCWYDMAGTSSRDDLDCPECGHTANTERSLGKTRRRPKVAGLALILLLVFSHAAYALTTRLQKVQERGLVAAIPTSLLIFASDPAHLNGVVDLSMAGPPRGSAAWEVNERSSELASWHAGLIAWKVNDGQEPECRAYALDQLLASESSAIDDAASDEGRTYIKSALARPLLDCFGRTGIPYRQFENAMLVSGDAGVHDDTRAVLQLITQGHDGERLTCKSLDFTIAVFDVGDLFQQDLERDRKLIQRVLNAGVNPSFLVWRNTSELLLPVIRAFDADRTRNNVKAPFGAVELPGRLVFWGSAAWVTRASDAVHRARNAKREAP